MIVKDHAIKLGRF